MIRRIGGHTIGFEEMPSIIGFASVAGKFESQGPLGKAFDKIIYDSSRSKPLRSTLSSFHNYIKRARDMSVKAEGRAEKSVAEHKAILEAIRSGNGELAEQLTARHIENARDNLLSMNK